MSLIARITADDGWHIGEDKRLEFTVYADADLTTVIDASAFALSWAIARTVASAILLEKTTGSGVTISGVFNADPAVNTQVVNVAIEDTDTQPDTGDPWAAGGYYHELKRTDVGLEGILARGPVTLLPSLH